MSPLEIVLAIGFGAGLLWALGMLVWSEWARRRSIRKYRAMLSDAAAGYADDYAQRGVMEHMACSAAAQAYGVTPAEVRAALKKRQQTTQPTRTV